MAENPNSENEMRHRQSGTDQPGGAATGRDEKPRRGGKKWLLLVVLIMAAIVTVFVWRRLAGRESTDDAQIDGHINPVASRVGGTVLEVLVDDNQEVKAGTLLVRIDPRDYEIALERATAELAAAEAAARAARTQVPVVSITTSSQTSGAQATLQSAEAGVAAAEKGVGTAQARLLATRARVLEARAVNTKAQQDLERMKQLVAKEEISKQQYDAAVAAADSSRAALDGAEAAVQEAERGVESAMARLVQARTAVPQAQAGIEAARSGPSQIAVMKSNAASADARVQQAKASLDRAQLDLEYTNVLAPVSGAVSMKNVELGQVVQRDQPLMAIVPLEDIWVTANFKEGQLNHMRVGQRVAISVDAYGGRKYQGRVQSIAAATGARFSLLPPENATGNYVKVVQRIPVKIVLDRGEDPQHILRLGMSVIPTVFTK
jgi:membrane fusion protein (multidrug efflux system)